MTTEEKLAYVGKMIDEIPGQLKKFKADGERIQAFFQDVKEAYGKTKNAEEKGAMLDMAFVLLVKGYTSAKNVKWYWPFQDPFKDFRLMADDIARNWGFERYKALRGI